MYDVTLNDISITVWGIIITILSILIGNLVTLIAIYISYRSNLRTISSGPFIELFKLRLETLVELVDLTNMFRLSYKDNLYKLTNEKITENSIEYCLSELDKVIYKVRCIEIKLRSYYSDEINALLNLIFFSINDFHNHTLSLIEDKKILPEEDVDKYIKLLNEMLQELNSIVKKECGVTYINDKIEKALSKKRKLMFLKRLKGKIIKKNLKEIRSYVQDREKVINEFNKMKAKKEIDDNQEIT